jgi:hypothetical protein
MERIESFLGLSVLLTGFSRIELLGTGIAADYLCTLEATLPTGVCDQLLSAWDARPTDSDAEAIADQILNDPKLGPVAQNLILLWYCGTWTALPEAWRSAYGAAPLDVNRVVSAEAYQAGLQWIAAGAHAPGSRQQGFAAWSMPPEGSSL